MPESVGDPPDDVLLRDGVLEDVSRFAHAFARDASLRISAATSASVVAGAGACRYSVTAAMSAAFQPPVIRPSEFAPAVDGFHEDETGVSEQASRVAQRDGLSAGGLQRRNPLDRLGRESSAQSLHCELHLGLVAPCDQVDGLQVALLAHSPEPTPRCTRTEMLPPVRLEHDAAILVGAEQLQARRREQCVQRVRLRKPVDVLPADLDHRKTRPEDAQLAGQSCVGRPVMRDLEHLDAGEREARRDVRLGVRGEQDVNIAE